MKKALACLAVLGFVGAANAGFTLFWSSTGLSDPAQYYNTALMNFQPYFVAPEPPPMWLPPGSYDLFLWGHFTPDWEGYTVYGIDLMWAGTATHDSTVAYRQKWGTGGFRQRWDNSVGIPVDGAMEAVTANGIIAFDSGDISHNLQTADGAVLLGAAHVTGVCGDHVILQLQDAQHGGNGFAYRDLDGTSHFDYVPAAADLWVCPEPASFALLALSLLVRHRTQPVVAL